MKKKISGQVKYFDFEGGFWGIIADDDYLPLNFPEQIKYDNVKVECTIVVMDDVMTAQSWGLPCKIISFSTITP